MNVAALQRTDRWLGAPLCLCLTLFRRLFEITAPPSSAPPKNILFVKLAEQGSTVLAYSALRRATEMAGRENVYFLLFKENRFILDALDVIPEGNVIEISTRNVKDLTLTALRALRRLRQLKIDAAIDLEFFARGSAAILFLSGAKRRVGFHSFFGAGPYRGDLLTHRLLYNPHLHTARTFQVMVEALNRDPETLPSLEGKPPPAPPDPPMFSPDAAGVESVRAMLLGGFSRADLPRLVLLNPNASDLLPLRRWPAGRYVQLAQRLLQEFPGIHVAFTGAPDEAGRSEQLVREVGSPRCISLAGKTTLRQLLILYGLSELLITNDSGPAHFAALTPIRVITLFGPETPLLYSATTSRNRALWAGLSCSPCVNAFNNRQSACRNNLCMQAITVDEVFQEAGSILHQGGAFDEAGCILQRYSANEKSSTMG